MKVEPAAKVPGATPRPDVARVEETLSKPPADQVQISGKPPASPTYGRVSVAGSSPGSSPEVSMVHDAHAQKLAEIRSRVESGAYNSREMIEKVVDRLLTSWKLGSKGSPDSSA